MLLFYIPPCQKTFPAWRNVKYQYGRGTKCSGTNRVFSHSQNCNFPEESFILSTFCNSARNISNHKVRRARTGDTDLAWTKELKRHQTLNMSLLVFNRVYRLETRGAAESLKTSQDGGQADLSLTYRASPFNKYL
jgi:hypothetical protein